MKPETLRIIGRITSMEDLEQSGQYWINLFAETGIVKPGMRVLDFGAGLGRLSVPLKKFGCDVTAIDTLDEMVDYLKSKGVRVFKSADLTPVLGERFDFVISSYVLQHMGRLRAREIIEQVSGVTNRFYFTIPLKKVSDNYLPGRNSKREFHPKGEVSFYYHQDEVEELVRPYFGQVTPVGLKNVPLFEASNG